MLKYLANVSTLRYDETRCTGCGLCATVCPHGVFIMSEKGDTQHRKARITDRDRCIECGACMRNCAYDAIRVRAGVGCATGVIFSALGATGDCCCVPPDEHATE